MAVELPFETIKHGLYGVLETLKYQLWMFEALKQQYLFLRDIPISHILSQICFKLD